MPYLQITCFFNGCGKQFNKYFNFKKHILRWHTTNYKTEMSVIYRCKMKDCNVCFTINLEYIVDTQFVSIKHFLKQSIITQCMYFNITQI
ncbi:hypothetical protein PUN28_018450 [Cardiocondyla obscurior]|uniref:C2H2-type domain-containing protein n=1 Tax=Cardiocondyla obscurior TaxID=286306 RepID=A0AAW2EET8_9HYME